MSVLDIYAQREVVAVRVRLGWRGKLILQVRNRVVRVRIFGDDEYVGVSPWRDADARRPAELAQAIRLLPPT